MSTSDWPDYTHGVVLSSGPVTDCPDWQEQVVAPGGGPIGGGGATYLQYVMTGSQTLAATATVLLTTASLVPGAYYFSGMVSVDTTGTSIEGTAAIQTVTAQGGSLLTIQTSVSVPVYACLSISGVMVIVTATTVTLAANKTSGSGTLFAVGSSLATLTGLTVIGPLTLI